MEPREQKIRRLQGPILILGGSGFIGANLAHALIGVRSDVVAVAGRLPAWRLQELPAQNVRAADLLVDSNLDALLNEVKPRTVFNCVAYGAYSFESDSRLIYQTNFHLTERILLQLSKRNVAAYIHAGSSSEYGDRASGPTEETLPDPNSDYSVSKVACANLLRYYGRKKALPCANLRLYSVYGPMEDASRLVPAIIKNGFNGRLPEFVHPSISRDFVFVDDVCEAFFDAALELKPEDYGESFNIGSGRETTIAAVAETARRLFHIDEEPHFTMPDRKWDVTGWYADATRANERLGWRAATRFDEGLSRTLAWYNGLESKEKYERASKRFELDTRHSVSAVVACYRDGQAIPIMYERLKAVFEKMGVDYEIIFVNDCSPDASEQVIRGLSRNDRHVIGISHARNFGSQSAFRSGMEIASMNSCVLLDGDLQDPPELIEAFVQQWREGADVVYGRRVKRQAPLLMQWAYKLFYRAFDRFSYLSIPHDAGDFSLMDKRVVGCLLQCPERDLFLRGLRAFVGFKQTGVDYVRPERMFGHTTNSLARNINWAKKGILSFSNAPLSMLSYAGTLLLLLTVLVGLGQVVYKLKYPEGTASGITTVLLEVMFFGSINLFAVGVVGEYIGKIFEEVKQRPHFIRRSIIMDGEVRAAENRTIH